MGALGHVWGWWDGPGEAPCHRPVQGAGCGAVALARLGLPMPHWALAARPVEGLPGSPHPPPLQVLDHQQQHGLLVDPSLPCVPGHPGESGAAALPTTALHPSPARALSLLRKGLPQSGGQCPACPCLPSRLTLLHCRSTSSSSSASSRSSSPSSARTRCATPTTSSGGWRAQPRPRVPMVHTLEPVPTPALTSPLRAGWPSPR